MFCGALNNSKVSSCYSWVAFKDSLLKMQLAVFIWAWAISKGLTEVMQEDFITSFAVAGIFVLSRPNG